MCDSVKDDAMDLGVRRSGRIRETTKPVYVPIIERIKKKSSKKTVKTEREKIKTKKMKQDVFELNPYVGSSSCPTYVFPVPRYSSTDEKEWLGNYDVILEWNPPHHIRWSCPCGKPFGIEKRHICKHIQSIMYHLNNPIEETKEKVKEDEEFTSVLTGLENMWK